MVVQSKKIKLGKKGMNYVTQVVDNNGCNFQPTDQENDVGIDGTIELFKGGIPTCQFIYAQIKTGKSFFDERKRICMIPVEKHREYWKKLPCPTIGIVCVVDTTETVVDAFWVDIQAYLNAHPNDTQIKFNATNENRFDETAFEIGFELDLFHKFPQISQIRLLQFIKAQFYVDYSYKALGVYYTQDISTWKLLFESYEKHDFFLDIAWFYDALTYIFSHPDHLHINGRYEFSEESGLYVKQKIALFKSEDIIQMLGLIGEDGIDRGTLGQSIEILISNIQSYQDKLLAIIVDESQSEDVRLYANYILAYHDKKFYLSSIRRIKAACPGIADEILEYMKEYGSIALY